MLKVHKEPLNLTKLKGLSFNFELCLEFKFGNDFYLKLKQQDSQ